ncbi:MAG: DUF2029 domain-containing protein [Proteobacteria bacterium]|nr:DUF2029 domain-containing protein [Pseudomonadota bacterium]
MYSPIKRLKAKEHRTESTGPLKERALRPIICFAFSFAALAGVLVALTMTAASSRIPVWRLVALTLAAYLPYSAALYAAWRGRSRLISAWPVIVSSLLLRLVLVAAPPVFSDDVYRYVWDGQVLTNGINPYRFSPEAPELESLRDEFWTQINHRSLRTIYPPLGEISFGIVTIACPHPTAFKLMSALSDMGVVCLVILLAGGQLGKRGTSDSRNQKAVFCGLIYGLCPLSCIETGMSGHLEPLAVVFTLLALLFLKRGRGITSVSLVGLGAGIKLVPALALPIIARRHRLAWLIFPIVFFVFYLPFLSSGTDILEMQDTFLRRWEGNAGLFALVKKGAESIIGASYGVGSSEAMVHLQFLDPIVKALDGTFLSLHKDGGFDPTAPGAFTLGDVSLAVSKIILGLCLVIVIAVSAIRRVEPIRATAWIFGALLIVTPVLHPWYLLWILPLAAVLGLWPWMILAALAPLSYLPLDNWWSHGIWDTPLWVPWIEYGLFVLAIVAYLTNKYVQHIGRRHTSIGTTSGQTGA